MNYNTAMMRALHESGIPSRIRDLIKQSVFSSYAKEQSTSGVSSFPGGINLSMEGKPRAKFRVLEESHIWDSRLEILAYLIASGLNHCDNIVMHPDLCRQMFDQGVSAGQEPMAAARQIVRMCNSFYQGVELYKSPQGIEIVVDRDKDSINLC